jgi:hypothetical protein
MKNDFIPRRDGDLDSFEENFMNKIDIHLPVLQLDPEEVTGTKNIVLEHRNAFSQMNSKKAESMSANEHNQLSKENAIVELRRFAKKIKASKQYSRAIGDDLRIIGSDSLLPVHDDLKPVLKASFNGQNVIIKYKKNACDGIRIYSRAGSETEFTFTAIETGILFTDPRPKAEMSKPEQREYYGIYLINYVEVGQVSDVVKIVVP